MVVLQSHHRNLVDKQMKILLSSFIAGKEESPKFSKLLSYKSLLELNWYPNYPRHEVQIHQITCPTTTLLNIQILKIIVLLKVSLLLNLGINAQLIWEKACISHVIPTWLGGEGELRKPPPHNIRVQNGNGKSDVSIDPVNRELPKFQQLKRAYLYIMTQNASLGQQFIVLMEV